jgi:hypothetical protein
MRNARLPMEYESQGAEFDVTNKYRYRLWRLWGGGTLTPWKTVCWILLNPSTADEYVLDPTLRRVESFTKGLNYDGFEVVNLFAFKATDPDHLTSAYGIVGPENDRYIQEAVDRNDLTIVGWGAEKIAEIRARVVLKMLGDRELFCLGMNKDGSPKHPLYMAGSTPVVSFPGGVRL